MPLDGLPIDARGGEPAAGRAAVFPPIGSPPRAAAAAPVAVPGGPPAPRAGEAAPITVQTTLASPFAVA